MEIQYITERALLARINRKLTPHDTQLKRCQADSVRYPEVGRFYHIATPTGAVLADHVNIETMARDIGVLADWERLERL
ncbi:hypothetical protein AvCA_40710 [Azotobacter vinelandii CA]|uniref:Uncharacterized protein n=2 Tax=Azotobacter vinelandii TaxID=354 RepID=C1DE98_AZOVD|nr:hypothetical protein [Azotobacter vinelandii]ACO80206.1 hypothetical protein Avin_40710 [Azotobacter vinelandii DJ]AGK16075.1 hypothetical protein AvCA_40710 [Azotobacter vinelandii CA]AGK21769.1 hypothetical protein AvCA6_40710 [Azotobacter vinelandii CA6]WKN21004.1 hypothetical protein AVAEIV_004053 [Azotobacter vinelandii]SFX73079.1 hypothetical protein SAMN04244547_02564 [Azotobacter vinelandii]